MRSPRACQPFISRALIARAGLPATTVHGGTSFVTTARAPTTAPSPTVTPGDRNDPAHSHAPSFTSVGAVTSGIRGSVWSCVAAHRNAYWLTVTFDPIRTRPTQ